MASLHLTADLHELTFGDLRQIVELTKDRPGDEQVQYEMDDVAGYTIPSAIKVALHASKLATSREGSCHGCE